MRAFFELKWELINGRPPSFASDPLNPFLHYAPMTLWNKTRDGRWVMPCNVYPKLRARATTLLRCDDSVSAVQNAMLQWRADELETAAAEAGLPFAMLRTTEEFMKELQYTEVLSREPLIRLEKISESDPVLFKSGGKTPLDGVRALGMGHVIAGSGIGRDLALFGADVLNIWQPLDWELDPFYWTSHVGMRSSIFDLHEKRDLEKMNQLLNDADVFFSNRRPGYQERFGLTADELCSKHPGLIHAKVVLFGETGPWSNRTGFDDVTGAVEELSMDEIKAQFETNFFGAVRVMKAVLPIMRKQKSGVIVNTSSIGGLIGVPLHSAYVGSKFALEGFSESMKYELEDFGIKIILIEPGAGTNQFH